MKKIGLGLLAIAILSLGFGAIWASAQNATGRGGRQEMFERMFNRIADELKLTSEQRTQAQQILADSKTRVQPLMEQLKQAHESTENLGNDGTFDEARVNQIADGQTAAMKQLFVEKERTKAALFAILTPEQRTQAVAMMERFKDGRRHRGFPGAGAPPPPAGF